MKRCPSCDQHRPLTDFYVKSKSGKLNCYCKDCDKARSRQWLEKNRDKRNAYHRGYMALPENNKRRRANRLKRDSESPRSVMQITLAHGLKRRPTANPATIDDLMEMFRSQDGLCALSGIRMTWNKGRQLPTSISLDRIDSSGGYSKDNLRLLCQCVNAFKCTMTDAQTIDLARAIIAKADQEIFHTDALLSFTFPTTPAPAHMGFL